MSNQSQNWQWRHTHKSSKNWEFQCSSSNKKWKTQNTFIILNINFTFTLLCFLCSHLFVYLKFYLSFQIFCLWVCLKLYYHFRWQMYINDYCIWRRLDKVKLKINGLIILDLKLKQPPFFYFDSSNLLHNFMRENQNDQVWFKFNRREKC